MKIMLIMSGVVILLLVGGYFALMLSGDSSAEGEHRENGDVVEEYEIYPRDVVKKIKQG